MDKLQPPKEYATEAANEALSLSSHIKLLQQEHRTLDSEITELYQHVYRDQLQLQRLKKKKLRLKDIIERLKDELIPDLNA